jgi:hypothetical protein
MSGISAQITNDLVIMTVLKVAASAVALASTVWCMVRTIATDDGTGHKRLTPSGQIALALAVGGFFIAGSMQGFETLTKISERRSAQIKAANEAALQATREARAARLEGMSREQLAVQRLTRAETLAGQADERSARAETRLLAITAAEDARRRDLRLAQDVNRGTRENLARTGDALTQLDRILHPIERLKIVIRWEIPLGQELPELRAAARSIDPAVPSTWPSWLRSVSQAGESTILEIKPDSSFYPTFERSPEVAAAIFATVAEIGFFGPEFPRSSINPPNISYADLYVRAAAADGAVLEYDVASHSFIVAMETGPNPELRRTPKIMSSLDLHASLMGIFASTQRSRIGRYRVASDRLKSLRRAMKPLTIDLRYSDRADLFGYDLIRSEGELFGVPMFRVDVDQQ